MKNGNNGVSNISNNKNLSQNKISNNATKKDPQILTSFESKKYNDFLRKKGGHLGLSLAKEYRGKGLGYKTTLLLIDKARSEFGIDDILLTNEPDNIASRKLCEKLGAELTDIDEHCHYWIRNMKKVK